MNQSSEIYTVAQIRELEQLAINKFSIAQSTLMQCAGASALTVLQELWPEAKQIAVLCGGGNNGGDGYVLARLAYAHDLKVVVYQVGDADKLQGEALVAAQACNEVDIEVHDVSQFHDDNVDVIVDAILGIGLNGTVRTGMQKLFQAINSSPAPVLAIDVPSGLNADTGEICGEAIIADATVSMIGLKRGLLTHAGVDYCGEVFCDRLQIPETVFDHVVPALTQINFNHYQSAFGLRRKNCHKGTFGHVLIVGGAPGYSGAARIAAEASARVGAGLVSVAYHEQNADCLAHRRPEIMARPIKDVEEFTPLLERADVVVIGPGLGQNDWGKLLLESVLKTDKPKVIDADALNIIAKMEAVELKNTVITPHPGEAARLLECTTAQIQQNRFAAAEKLQEKYKVVCVLKGAGSIIADHEGMVLCSEGNPGMASGGMGDLLSGILGGLLAQHVDVQHAAKIGVSLHARAGDLAAEEFGERGLLALDLLPFVQQLVNP